MFRKLLGHLWKFALLTLFILQGCGTENGRSAAKFRRMAESEPAEPTTEPTADESPRPSSEPVAEESSEPSSEPTASPTPWSVCYITDLTAGVEIDGAIIYPTRLDTDCDGIADDEDADVDGDGNRERPDSDGDGIGDWVETDDDNDGVEDICDPHPDSTTENDTPDKDGDGINVLCDEDDDGDGLPDALIDADGDGVEDAFDSCPNAANSGTDQDGDGVDDACDPDLVIEDLCPSTIASASSPVCPDRIGD